MIITSKRNVIKASKQSAPATIKNTFYSLRIKDRAHQMLEHQGNSKQA